MLLLSLRSKYVTILESIIDIEALQFELQEYKIRLRISFGSVVATISPRGRKGCKILQAQNNSVIPVERDP
jgi:hypothetical protein